MGQPDPISAEERDICQRVLHTLAEHPELCLQPDSDYQELQRAAAALSRAVKRHRKHLQQDRDRESIQQSGLRQSRRQQQAPRQAEMISHGSSRLPAAVKLTTARHCYVCKERSEYTHHFYDSMCPVCGELNFDKRRQSADLRGRTAMVTGGRVKIGFQTGLKLLRAGAQLIVTTRFPVDAATRYAQEADFENWHSRLRIFGVDFRHMPGLELFTDQLCQEISSLDILINNAAQTIRRPPAFYEHVWQTEQTGLTQLSPEVRALLGNTSTFRKTQTALTAASAEQRSDMLADPAKTSHIAAALSQVALLPEDDSRADFPAGQLDEHGQQIDLRKHNSWVARVPDVSFVELLEVHAVNTFAPFVLLQRLEPLLLANEQTNRFVVNVSAMEGRFHHFKDGRHPHTNMAKAALNMLTRTCADHYAERRLYMNSVDTGWVTNEFPHAKVTQMKTEGFEPPLDEIDGAARVLAPVFDAGRGELPVYGQFLKDYRSISW